MGFLDRLKRAAQKADNTGLASLLKTATVYNQGGVPIVDQLDSIAEVSRKAMEGGFLVAITQFSNMKLSDGDQTTTISFESKENGTFIVTKTVHFIGSLLWRADCNIPIEHAKEVLADLMGRIERGCQPDDLEGVQKLVQDFITISS